MSIITITTTSGPFTGYNLGQQRALVLRMLRVANPVRFSPTAVSTDYDWIDDSLNSAQDEWVRMTKCLRTYVIIELKDGQRIYNLPKDYIDIMAAYYYDASLENGYKELTITTIEELNDEVSDWRVDEDTPARFYIDRMSGTGNTFGLYPIPDTDGTVPIYSGSNGAAADWVCPIYVYNKDYVELIRATSTYQYYLPTDATAVPQIKPSDHNLLLEYYRLPTTIQAQSSDTSQISEIPREYQRAIAYYAAADLLSNNPEDSVEFKRSQFLMGKFTQEVQTYINKRKRALSGRNLRARPAVWNWQKNMTYAKELA